MEINIQDIIKNISKKGNSATLLISHKTVEKQLEFIEEFARGILELHETKSYKTHPDLLGIWPENINGKTIKIKQIHDFIRKIQLKPYSSKFKVGVIISAEKMTKEAQNALLKTLEEPPTNTFLILTTTSVNKLLPTIISRCQVLEFKDDEKGQIDLDIAKTILKANIVERFQMVERIVQQKDKLKMSEDINDLTEKLLLYFRKQLLKMHKNNLNIVRIIDLIEATQTAINKNVNTRLALESLMINLPLKGKDY